MVNFTIQIPDGNSHSPALILRLVFLIPWFSLLWEILIMLLPQIPLTFLQTKKVMSLFIAQTITIVALTGTVLMII